MKYYLNPAIGKFIGDARHQGCRRINILQALDNEADSVKAAIKNKKIRIQFYIKWLQTPASHLYPLVGC